jgi:hypothetical protein
VAQRGADLRGVGNTIWLGGRIVRVYVISQSISVGVIKSLSSLSVSRHRLLNKNIPPTPLSHCLFPPKGISNPTLLHSIATHPSHTLLQPKLRDNLLTPPLEPLTHLAMITLLPALHRPIPQHATLLPQLRHTHNPHSIVAHPRVPSRDITYASPLLPRYLS